jgi:hypothetical protein
MFISDNTHQCQLGRKWEILILPFLLFSQILYRNNKYKEVIFMGMLAECIREMDAEYNCKKIKEKITKYPEASKALKEFGLEMLKELDYIPDWSKEFYDLFQE